MTERPPKTSDERLSKRSNGLNPNKARSVSDYWKLQYNRDEIVDSGCPQENVGRTVNGIPIEDGVWEKTIEYLAHLLNIGSESHVLELCCGNGMLIGNLADICKKAWGIDYSSRLIEQLKSAFGNRVKTAVKDVMDVECQNDSLDAVLIYFSIQHFDQRQTLHLIQESLGWLRSGGKLLIGDIPDLEKKWAYLDSPKYRRDYFQRLLDGTPKIGNWFQREFFSSMADYFDNIQIEVLNQPEYQINAKIRFDVVFTKGQS